MAGYRLFWAKGSGAFPAAVVLQAAQVPCEMIELELRQPRPAGYEKINPTGQIPALILPDGQIMTESAALAWYLADKYPAANLLPGRDDGRRATLLRWLVFGATALYEDDLRFYYPDRYTHDPAGVPGVKAAAGAAFARHMEMVIQALQPGPFLLGATMTIVDVYLAMLATWEPGRLLLKSRPELPRLVEAVKADARVAPLWVHFAME